MVDWSLLQQPNIVGNAIKYREAGLGQAQDIADRNALEYRNGQAELERTRIMGARRTAAQQYASGNRQGAINTAIGEGEFDLAKSLQGLGDEERELAKQRLQTSGSLLAGWRGMTPEQRVQAKQQVAPQLAAQGWKPEEIQALPTDDVGIQNGIGLAVSADKILNGERADSRLEKGPNLPPGYRSLPNGNLEYIPGGPADPRTAGRLAGSKRAPKSAGGGGSSGAPAGFTMD